MLELRLHGALGRDFGKVWNLDVYSVREALSAVCALKPGFRRAIIKMDRGGMIFKVKANGLEIEGHELPIILKDAQVDVIPVVRGSGGAAGRAILGAVLIVVGVVDAVFDDGADIETDDELLQMGTALLLGSVAQLLAPHPKKADSADDTDSWTINGPLNTTAQGTPVPVVYGEVLTGGVPISAGLTTSSAAIADSTVASGDIGGDFDDVMRFGGPVTAGQVVLNFSLSPHNAANISRYNWSITGLALSSSHVITGGSSATIAVTITYNIATVGVLKDSFTVSCFFTGNSVIAGRDGNGNIPNVVATATNSGFVNLDTRT